MGKAMKIAIVDDEKDMRLSITQWLALSGYDTESFAKAEDALVMGDRMRIEQVLINLIRNAIDAIKTVKDPEIEIILSTGQMISLTVRDNGFGIADLDDLFEPFYTTKQAGEGTGLGLAISSGIINDMGGRLMARNSDEGGAVFEVILPPIDEYNTGKEPFEAAE